MNLDRKLILKTPKHFSKGQVSAVIIFGAAGLFVISIPFWQGVEKFKDFLIWGLIILLDISGLHVLYGVVRSWWKVSYTIEIDGDILRGWNLWGQEFVINLNDVVEVKREKKNYRTIIVDKYANQIIPSGSMDYHGFLMDYILTNYDIPKVDWAEIEKLRKSYYWPYTKRNPFQTPYRYKTISASGDLK